jgi:hypothetical protein
MGGVGWALRTPTTISDSITSTVKLNKLFFMEKLLMQKFISTIANKQHPHCWNKIFSNIFILLCQVKILQQKF